MLLLLYEDSFEGFLSALFDGYNRDCVIMRECKHTGASLFEIRRVENNPAKNERLLRGMDRLSGTLAQEIYYAWLSELPDIENSILETLRLGFAIKRNPMDMLSADCVKSVEGARRKVWAESHLYLGLVRFHEAGANIYVADIGPKYQILPVIAEHFHERFKPMRFVIRDIKRKSALVSEPGGFFITELPEDIAPLPENGMYERLWKRYFTAVTIENRINPAAQRRFVALCHREYLHEFSKE